MKFVIEEKDPGEIVTLTFPYAKELGAAEISSALIAVTLEQGVDADPSSLLNGAPQLSGTNVLQGAKAGQPAARYKVKCLATLNDGRKLMRVLYITVRTF